MKDFEPPKTSPPGSTPAVPAAPPKAGATGKVVHDARGNAVWDWLATTSRVAIEATSRLLKKLDAAELKIEDSKDEELRIMPEPSSGAGYDPYNQVTKAPKAGRK